MTQARRFLHDLIHDRQHNRILRLSFPNNDAPASKFVVNRIVAIESLSRNFEFTVELLSDDDSVAFKEVQGKLINIELVRRDGGLRYFSGYIFTFRRHHSDGGFTIYEATLGPWLKFLSLRKDSYLFHNQTLREQTESIFQDYGTYAQWDWNVTGDDPKMTEACQFNETDFNYLSRRWEAAGLYYWYEHYPTGHKLIVSSDSMHAPVLDGGPQVRFHSEGNSLEEDAVDHWSPIRRVTPSTLALNSFNFKDPRPCSVVLPTLNQQGKVPEIESYEYSGAYAFRNSQDGDTQCRIRLEEIEATAKHVEGAGNNRFLMPGRWFQLVDHFKHNVLRHGNKVGNDNFLLLSVHHTATNNYLQQPDEKIQYRNRFVCTRKNVKWRPGRNFNSTDTKIVGPQTAIVVGPSGPDSIYTDEYGRVRVQFHWDRAGSNDERSSAWLRVSSSWAGAELGATAIPRVGTEVIVQWLDGSPDRPIITGAVFNERNMPPWSTPTQRALTGFRSRELAPSSGNSPVGRSNHLILDDTNKEIQAQLKSDHLQSQLSLGYIKRIENNRGRTDARGEGWELRTDGHGAIRAAKGMLVTTEARMNARGPIKSMEEAVENLDAAIKQQQSLAKSAEENGTYEADGNQCEVAHILQEESDSIRGTNANPSNSPELTKPHLIVSSAAGISTSTTTDTHISSGRHTAITTGRSFSLAAGENIFASVRHAFRLFVQQAGIKMVAAAGDIDVKALSNSIKILAKLEINQSANQITITAKEELVINGGGSFAKFSAGSIEIGTSGTLIAHAATHSFPGPKTLNVSSALTNAKLGNSMLREQLLSELVKNTSWVEFKLIDSDGPIPNERFILTDPSGNKHVGNVDNKGTARIEQLPAGRCNVEFPELGVAIEVLSA